jgi:hypothetical protein
MSASGSIVGRSANRPQMSAPRGEPTSQDATRFCHILHRLARSYCLALSRGTEASTVSLRTQTILTRSLAPSSSPIEV